MLNIQKFSILVFGLVGMLVYFLFNFIHLCQTCRYHKIYKKRIISNPISLTYLIKSVTELFDSAKTNGVAFTRSKSAHVVLTQVSMTELLYDPEFSGEMNLAFEKTKGVFIYRMKNAFNPLFWIRTINQHLPLRGSIPGKFIRFLFWLLSAIGVALIEWCVNRNAEGWFSQFQHLFLNTPK